MLSCDRCPCRLLSTSHYCITAWSRVPAQPEMIACHCHDDVTQAPHKSSNCTKKITIKTSCSIFHHLSQLIYISNSQVHCWSGGGGGMEDGGRDLEYPPPLCSTRQINDPPCPLPKIGNIPGRFPFEACQIVCQMGSTSTPI